MFRSSNYGNPYRGSIINQPLMDRYGRPIQMYSRPSIAKPQPRPRVNYNQGKTIVRDTVYNRKLEEMNSSEYYKFMLEDEQNQPQLRKFDEKIQYTEEFVNVFKFFFKEAYQKLEQKKQTCHLAMTYFTETIMRCPNLRKNEIGIIAGSALLCASKFDELDYCLPPASLVLQMMNCSAFISQYDQTFEVEDMILCEKNICDRLNWNFHQYTPYHFLQIIMDQGIICDKDAIFKSSEEKGVLHQDNNLSLDSSFLTHNLSNYLGHQSTRDVSGNKSFSSNGPTPVKGGKSSRRRLGTDDNMESDTTQCSLTVEVKCKLSDEDTLKANKVCEYLLGLSLLIFELQEFAASKVAAACVLASRKILKIHPLWSTKLEKTTKYSYLDLLKCMSMLLDNYNDLKIGRKTMKTCEALGKQPHGYEPRSRLETSFDSEIMNTKVKSSISPRKQRKIISPPELTGKTKSSMSNGADAKTRKETYYEKYKNSPPSGILKNRKNMRGTDIAKENFSINMKIIQPEFDSSDSEDLGTSKKVSFANNISVQHGSKKLIESIKEPSNKPYNRPKDIMQPKRFKEDDILQLRKHRSYNDQNIRSGMGDKVYNTFKTPLEARIRNEITTRTTAKPPMPTEKRPGIQTTEKMEMNPKAWKANRIRNHNKKVSDKNIIPLRKPYKSIERDNEECSVFSEKKPIGVDCKKHTNEPENLSECNSDEEDAPKVLSIKLTKQPSFLADKHGPSEPMSSQLSISGRYAPKLTTSKSTYLNRSVGELRPGDIQKNQKKIEANMSVDVSNPVSISQRYHNVRSNHINKETQDKPNLLSRLNTTKNTNTNKPPSIMKCFSVSVPDKAKQERFNENSKICQYTKCCEDTSLDLSSD